MAYFQTSRHEMEKRKQERSARRSENARFNAEISGQVVAPKLADIEAMLDRLFSAWVIKRDTKAFGRCRLCGVREIEVCYHVIPRGAHAIRWDEENGWGCCGRCNANEQQNREHYKALHRQIMGEAAYEALAARGRVVADWTMEKLTTLRDVLKNQIETLK